MVVLTKDARSRRGPDAELRRAVYTANVIVVFRQNFARGVADDADGQMKVFLVAGSRRKGKEIKGKGDRRFIRFHKHVQKRHEKQAHDYSKKCYAIISIIYYSLNRHGRSAVEFG
jgi:hypothetical protein